MNFHIEIKKHFDIIAKTISKRKNEYQNLLSLINELSKCELIYIKSLRKVYSSFPLIDLGDEFKDSLIYLKEHINNKLLIHESFNSSLNVDIMKEANDFFESKKGKFNDIMNYQTTLSNYEKEIATMMSLLEKSKNNYDVSAKKSEDALYDYEMSKKDYFIQKNGNKFEEVANNTIKNAKENEKAYLNSISQINGLFQKFYFDVNDMISTSFLLENDINQSIKQTIEKFYNHSLSLNFNQKTNLEYGLEISKNINVDNDNNQTFKDIQNVYNTYKPNSFEFHPYQLSILSKKNIEHDEKAINIVKTMKENFKGVGSNYNEKEDQNTTTFNNLTKIAIYHGECMNKAERNTLYKYIKKERKYRKKFLFCLNSQRNDGRMEMNPKTISLIGNILTLILDSMSIEYDFEMVKFTIILSQTFYCKNRNKEKIYLQKQIFNHSVFQKIDFWYQFIDYSIEQGLNELKSRTELFLQNTYFSQLIAITNNMLEFQLQKEKIYDIIETTKEKYKIIEENIGVIKTIVNDKVYENVSFGSKMKTIRSSDTLLNNKDFREKYEIAYMEKDDYIAELEQEEENDYNKK